MTELQITSWRDLPSLVVAREGEDVVKVLLPPRFQEAIDEAAMRLGDTGAEGYLEGWARSEWTPADGNPALAASLAAKELDERWSPEAVATSLDSLA